ANVGTLKGGQTAELHFQATVNKEAKEGITNVATVDYTVPTTPGEPDEPGEPQEPSVPVETSLHTPTIVLEKVDYSTGELLDGAVFDLKDSKGKIIKAELVTDKNGKIVIDNLSEGSYVLTEIKAPIGYVLDSRSISFTVKYNDDSTIRLKKTNKKNNLSKNNQEANNGEKTFPKTGSKNSFMFTVIGFTLLIMTVGLFVLTRKKVS
ncbi:LPXTG cell wall anchor domain-containing protein, partial [Enterococcus casseliflavus]|nr:LPXTG cell wall anchor domain-containing protein [Enterococcus casseliflavus]